MTRLEQLLALYSENQNDSFVLYGLALEYMNTSIDEAIVYFNELLDKHAEYLPTYYQAGKALEKKGKTMEAQEVYKKGIELATQLNDNHTLSELKGALLAMEDDDTEEDEW